MRKLILFIIETKSTKHNTDGLYIKEVFGIITNMMNIKHFFDLFLWMGNGIITKKAY